MNQVTNLQRKSGEAVVLRRHGLAWVPPAMLVLFAPLTWGLTLIPAAWRAAQLWRSRQRVEAGVVVVERGILFRKRRELPLTAVEFVQVKPCLFGQAVDCGTVIVHGAGGVSLVLRQLAHPRSAQRAIQRAMSAAPREREPAATTHFLRQPTAA